MRKVRCLQRSNIPVLILNSGMPTVEGYVQYLEVFPELFASVAID
jgi:hypothetical protein